MTSVGDEVTGVAKTPMLVACSHNGRKCQLLGRPWWTSGCDVLPRRFREPLDSGQPCSGPRFRISVFGDGRATSLEKKKPHSGIRA